MDFNRRTVPHPRRGEGSIKLSKKLSYLIQIARKQLKLIMGEDEENSVAEVLSSSDDYLTEPETDSNQPQTSKKQSKRKRKTTRNQEGYTFPRKTNNKSKASVSKPISTSNKFETLNNNETEIAKENQDIYLGIT